jgi:hypothetical protein
MSNKKRIIVLIVSVLILGAFIAIGFQTSEPTVPPTAEDLESQPWPSEEVEKLNVSEKTDSYTITAIYPKTNSDSISMNFYNYVNEQISQFKQDTSWIGEVGSASEGALTLDIDYKSENGSLVQNYIFSTSSYTGGAHGLQVRKTFSYNKTGQLLSISNLFSNGISGLKTLSALVQKELMKREGADAKWIEDGAGPVEENYTSFVVSDTGVTILFDQYQVAPYSDGPIDIFIPVTDFVKVANPEIFPKQP